MFIYFNFSLALVKRDDTKFINEPHAGGGNPVLAIQDVDADKSKAIFTDMLGTSLGSTVEDQYNNITKTSFGADTTDTNAFFTGKPYINELGYAFLFRNYNGRTGKWQTQDPLGYPTGFNNFAYCDNNTVERIDFYGLCGGLISHNIKNSHTSVQYAYTGRDADILVFTCHGPSSITKTVSSNSGYSININLSSIIPNAQGSITLNDTTNITTSVTYTNPVSCGLTAGKTHEQIGTVKIELQVWVKVTYAWDEYECGAHSDPVKTGTTYYIEPKVIEEVTCKTKDEMEE